MSGIDALDGPLQRHRNMFRGNRDSLTTVIILAFAERLLLAEGLKNSARDCVGAMKESKSRPQRIILSAKCHIANQSFVRKAPK